MCFKSGEVENCKHMKMDKDQLFNEAVIKWYVQQRSNGVNVCEVEIVAAAAKLATHLSFTDFKGSDGWLWQFRNHNRLFDQVLHGKAADAVITQA